MALRLACTKLTYSVLTPGSSIAKKYAGALDSSSGPASAAPPRCGRLPLQVGKCWRGHRWKERSPRSRADDLSSGDLAPVI